LLVAKKRTQYTSFYDQQRSKRKITEARELRARKAAKKISMFGVVAAFAAASIMLVAHYTTMISVNYQIDRSRSELRSLQDRQQHLKLEIASLRSPERLERIALEEIGMQYPQQSQFIILTAGAQTGN